MIEFIVANIIISIITLIAWFFAVRASIRQGMNFEPSMVVGFIFCFLPVFNMFVLLLMCVILLVASNASEKLTEWFRKQ